MILLGAVANLHGKDVYAVIDTDNSVVSTEPLRSSEKVLTKVKSRIVLIWCMEARRGQELKTKPDSCAKQRPVLERYLDTCFTEIQKDRG